MHGARISLARDFGPRLAWAWPYNSRRFASQLASVGAKAHSPGVCAQACAPSRKSLAVYSF